MKALYALFGAVWEYLKRVNKVPQKEIEAREREITESKDIKYDISQIGLTKRFMRKLDKWYKWAVDEGFVEEGEDKLQAYERWRQISKKY